MSLDIRTIFMCVFVGNLFTIILMGAYQRGNKDKALNVFLIGKFFEIIGFFLVSLRDFIPDLISLLVGNTLVLSGSGIETIALLVLLNKWEKPQKYTYTVLVSLSVASYLMLIILGTDDWTRIIQASLFIIIFLVYPMLVLFRSKSSTILKKVTGALYFVIMISMTLRIVNAFINRENVTLMTNNVSQSISMLGLLVAMIVVSYGFLLIAKEKSDIELKNAAMFDGLTGILNRSTFSTMVENLLKFSKRNGASCALIMMDIDFFKKVNDTYGHIVGDQVLIDLTTNLKKQLREYDLFCRYGGEEFAVFLNDISRIEIMEIAERMRYCIENSDNEINYTMSIGLSVTTAGEKEISQMYKEADIALYNAKETGRNKVVIFNQ